MAKELIFSVSGATYSAAPVNLDREMLLYKEIPFSESNEVIAIQMQILLTKIQAYRDKHYPQSAK